jgi:hypothetical protein
MRFTPIIVAIAAACTTGCATLFPSRPVVPADTYPEHVISNGAVRARVLVPDAVAGYYRSSRFDWSGMVAQVEYAGHTYFAEWQREHSPRGLSHGTGTAEAFGNPAFGLPGPPGFREAKPGESFLKVGVGTLLREDRGQYLFYKKYPIADGGTWTTTVGADWVESRQLLDTGNWGYDYVKRISIAADAPVLVISRTLTNTGSRTIDTSHFCHNFLRIDDSWMGRDYAVHFPFRPTLTSGDFRGYAGIAGDAVYGLRPMPGGVAFFGEVGGHFSTVDHHVARIENLRTGAGLTMSGDLPVERWSVFATSLTFCVEPFVRITVQPGETKSWSTRYRFHRGGAVASE